MAAATIVATQLEWGIYITCTGGTGTYAQVLASPKQSIKIAGFAVGGNATTDIITISNGNGLYPVFSGAVGTPGTLASLPLGAPVRLDGLTVSFAGTTAGVAYIYTSNQ